MITDDLKSAYNEVVHLWALSFTEFEIGSQVPILLSKAAEAMRDACLCAENPRLKPVPCVAVGGSVHACEKDGKTICGVVIDLSLSIVPWHRVTSCPECVAILTKEPQ